MTRLKALELFGFKSFADRTCFDFPAGITAVVGPNGAGKSNVVDAIKWVLGEQSARSLRGKEMTDVIFAGSAGRRPLNVAEVALVFDNVGRELPVATDEVRIMRRVYRAGESEYLVNGEPARLRDIRELFSGTGAATQAYSVIEQGRVDALLVASGRDRRAVFEEAAGITRFRGRRAEALRRLERAEQNRQRLADIAGEVSSRLEVVRHQAARARRWKQYQDRLRTLRLAAATRDLATVDATVAAVQAALAAGRAASQAASEEEQAAALEAERAANRHEEARPRLATARAAAELATQRAVAAEATFSLLAARRAEYAAELERAATAVRDAMQAERRAAAAAAEADAGVAALAAALADLGGELATRERAAAGTHDDAASARAELDAAMLELDEARRRQLRLTSERDLAMARAADARRAADAARSAVDATRARLARLGEARAAGEGQELALVQRVAAADREVDAIESSQRETTAALQAAWRDLAAWQAAGEAARERQGMLRELIDRHEGASEAARRLLAAAPESVPGFGGMVGATLEAAVEWAPLVDVVLGSLAHGLLVTPLADAVDWQASWAESPAGQALLAAGGRVAMVCPDDLREPDPFEPGDSPGVVGRLDRLVSAAAPPASAAPPLLRRLLGGTWVVERLADAVPLLAVAPVGTSFITRRGDRIVAGGPLEFGAAAAATGLVARRAELRVLEARARELDRAVGDATSTVQELQSRAERLADDGRQAAARRRQDAEALATTRGELSRGMHEQRAAEESAAAAERDARAAEQRAAGADAEADAARADAESTESRVAVAAASVARCQAAIAALERSRGAAIDEIHRLRVEHAAGAERLARGRDAANAAGHARGARRDELDRARRHEGQAADRLAAHDLELLAAGAERAEATWIAAQAGATVQALVAESDAAGDGQRAALTRIEAARRDTARLAAELHARELEAGEANHQRTRIVERIRDEYDIDIDAAAAPPAADTVTGDDTGADPVPDDRDELEARIDELRRKLASMSTVNLAALAEAEELAERLAKLEAQLADVTAAREAIEQLIARIDDESRRLLGDTIETVRGHFRELFERVFGGGQADLVLEPGVDLLETAVEIVARPPGKEPRNISLLSGGEKTMTCVALLLAIFRSRPSPFCVLDEVDAALDEANVDRFVGVLRDFLSATQFIVVTHSKKTMAAANTLYGVTMEESGVSKRISVRFESTAAREAARAA